MDTLYGWRSREKERAAALEAVVGGRSEGELAVEIETLRKQLRQAQQDVEILQEALVFLPSAGNREPQPQAPVQPGTAGPLAGVGHVQGASYQRAGILPLPAAS